MNKKKIMIVTLVLIALLILAIILMQRDTKQTTNDDVLHVVASNFELDYSDEKTVTQPYIDITNDFGAKNEVAHLTELGLQLGDTDGQFRPTKVVTHSEANILFEAVQKITKENVSFSYEPRAVLTHEELALALVSLFQLTSTDEDIHFKDEKNIQERYVQAMKTVVQHRISTSQDDFIHPQASIDRATFAIMLYRAFVVSENLEPIDYDIVEGDHVEAFSLSLEDAYIEQLDAELPVYVRSELPLTTKDVATKTYTTATDTTYSYEVDETDTTVTVTVREFKNGDQFVFSTLSNDSNKKITVDIIERQPATVNAQLFRYDRYPLERIGLEVFGDDKSTYPIGVQRLATDEQFVAEKMIGQAYRSQQLTQKYEETGGTSYVRDLQAEYEPLSTVNLSTAFLTFTTLKSKGNDIVDSWYMTSTEPLFNSNDSMESWMLETSQNFIKRNKWYTANGVYTKMATSIEPMPQSEQGFGRNLLMQKEDRALVLYKEQGDRYYENLVNNAFVSLEQFKGNETYWKTEVTSTYLKGLYNMTAPFIDTRFNEQIALFYLNAGELFNIEDYKEPLRNYADLLVSRKEAGHVIEVAEDAYYISDYFPVEQEITTHASMNHILGGLNVLLLAYEHLKDDKYLQTANAIYKAIELEKHLWLRDTGDIWYRVNPKKEFAGDDYKHLTLEDLINTYSFYSRIDKSKLPLIEEMMASKAEFLSENELGYTIKIKNGLEAIGKLHYLPDGELFTDAH